MKKKLLLLIFALFSFIVNVQGTCNNLFPFISPDGQHLYFSSDRHGGNYEIYKSDIDGVTNLVRLTFTSTNNLYPTVNFDGSKIAFQSGDYGSSAEIFIMNSDGTGLTQLTNNSTYDGYPNFSPDGQTIVFDGWDVDPYPEIFTMDISGANRTQLTNVAGPYWQNSPMFDPTGTHIYFYLGYNADNNIARMDLNGSNIINITPPNPFGDSEFGMRFSPDGSQIIFSTTQFEGYNNGSDIVIADTLGNNWNRITLSTAGEWFHSSYWHPTNNKIYYGYMSSTLPEWQVYEMNSSGSGILLLTNCALTGVAQNVAGSNTFKAYPVPAVNELNLLMPSGYVAEINDINGRLIISTNLSKIDLQAMESGIYFVKFINQDGKVDETIKFMKLE